MVRLQWLHWINYSLLVSLLATFTSTITPDPSFRNHFLTYPRVYHAREKRSVSSSSDFREETGHLNDLVVELNLAGRNVTLDLRLNRDLIPKQYFERYQKHGDYIVKKPNEEKMELCHYNGHVRNVADSWVAVSTCDGIKGVVYDGNELHYVESTASSTGPSGIASLDGPHLVYRHSDLQSNFSCGTPDLLPSGLDHTIHAASTHRFKRNAPNVRRPFNANERSRYIELVLVIDFRFYNDYNRDVYKIIKRCKDLANIINSLYEPLNIFVALVGVIIWTEKEEFAVVPNGDLTLNHFLSYRKTFVRDHPNDNAQFLTSSPFDGNVVGKALKGPICTYEFSGGVNVDHSRVVGLVATTIAHEMGHNLGMEHDNETENTCKCPKERCIMAPSSSSLSPTDWSSCSQEYLALAFEHGMDYCLRNKPVSLFDGPVCGNGFVEQGEECDCGLKEKCTTTCCDPVTCKLSENATCGTGECCDLQTCQLRGLATECRSADRECDLPEYCDGNSEYCPEDVFKIDGVACDGGSAFCYEGNCRSHTSQCKVLWGPSGSSSDPECYKLNNQGSMHGNCGYDRLTDTFQKCDDHDVDCGMLQCKHATEKLQFGTESAANLSAWFITTDKLTIACRTAVIDLGLNDVDPGLTPDGAKCGENRMCWKKRCVPVDSFRSINFPNACPNNCNGNGVCNTKGQCHCNNGFAPPDCDESGPGGSLHSGPAENPQNYNKLRTIFWYVMLTLIPLVIVLLLYPHYVRKSPTYFWKRNQRRTVLCEKTVHTKTINVYANGAAGASCPRQSLVGAEKPNTARDEASRSSLQDSLLGNFKGFSIVPLPKTTPAVQPSPSRPAPDAPPTSPKIVRAAPTSPPTIMQPQSRPLISSPVLDNTTSMAAKKLINKDTPVVRPAPAPPAKLPSTAVAAPLSPEKPKEHSYVTLSRIASLVSKSPPAGAAIASKNDRKEGVVAQKAAKIERGTLHKLQISDPIPLTEPSLPTLPLPVAQDSIVMRAQSMRQAKKTQRAAVHSFGSMRLPGRPPSVVNCRPTAPPPHPPSNAPNHGTETDENIYAVIDEHPTDAAVRSATSGHNGKGLLDEIVNEMQARNLASMCKADERLYVNGGESGEYLKPIKSTQQSTPNCAAVPKLKVPEKAAPGYRPFAAKKPAPSVVKPATNSSQSAVSAAISKYNDASSRSQSAIQSARAQSATESAQSQSAIQSPKSQSVTQSAKSQSTTQSAKSQSTIQSAKSQSTIQSPRSQSAIDKKPIPKSATGGQTKEPLKSTKASHVASIHKKFEAQSKFVPGKRGPTS